MLAGEKVPETALKHAADAAGGGAVSGRRRPPLAVHSLSRDRRGGVRSASRASRSRSSGVGAVGAAAAEIGRAGGLRADHADRPRRRRAVEPRPGSFSSTPRTRRGSRPRRTPRRRVCARSIPSRERRARSSRISTRRNARELLAGHDLVFDALGQLRDAAARLGRRARPSGSPSIYAACVGAEGRVAVSVPGRTPCLRCYLEALPPAGLRARRATRPASSRRCRRLVASIAMTEVASARRGRGAVPGMLVALDVWEGGFALAAAVRDGAPVAALPGLRGRALPGARRRRARRRSSSSAAATSVQVTPARARAARLRRCSSAASRRSAACGARRSS